MGNLFNLYGVDGHGKKVSAKERDAARATGQKAAKPEAAKKVLAEAEAKPVPRGMGVTKTPVTKTQTVTKTPASRKPKGGRPKKDNTLSIAERAKAYRERKRAKP